MTAKAKGPKMNRFMEKAALSVKTLASAARKGARASIGTTGTGGSFTANNLIAELKQINAAARKSKRNLAKNLGKGLFRHGGMQKNYATLPIRLRATDNLYGRKIIL